MLRLAVILSTVVGSALISYVCFPSTQEVAFRIGQWIFSWFHLIGIGGGALAVKVTK